MDVYYLFCWRGTGLKHHNPGEPLHFSWSINRRRPAMKSDGDLDTIIIDLSDPILPR
jgi:hypothetical protein